MTVPLLQVALTFDDEGTKYKHFVENRTQMARLYGMDIPPIVHIACTYPLAYFVQR